MDEERREPLSLKSLARCHSVEKFCPDTDGRVWDMVSSNKSQLSKREAVTMRRASPGLAGAMAQAGSVTSLLSD